MDMVMAATLSCLGCGRLPEAEFDAGGVAYDFAAITESRFPIPKIGDKGNLVDAEEFFEDNWGKGREAKAKFITLPDNKGSRFRLSFKYKMRHTKGELGYAFVFYYNRDPKTGKLVERKDVKASYSYYDVWVLQNEWAQLNRFSREFTAPAGPDIWCGRTRSERRAKFLRSGLMTPFRSPGAAVSGISAAEKRLRETSIMISEPLRTPNPGRSCSTADITAACAWRAQFHGRRPEALPVWE
jgi:hypothetical protein